MKAGMRKVMGQRGWLFFGFAAFAVGCAVALLSAAFFTPQTEEKEQAERLALYWSRYVSLELDSGSGPASLQEHLLLDAGAYPLEGGFRLTVTDLSGKVIASYARGAGQGQYTSDKPYLANGAPAGTVTAAAAPSPSPAGWQHALLAGTAAALLAGIVLWLAQKRWRRRLAGWADEAGGILRQNEPVRRMPQTFFSEEEALAAALEQISLRFGQLQTARRTMVAEVAHELRTPLAVLRAAMDNALYENRPLAPDRLAILSEQVAAMSRLVQDLQDLTLAESGTLQLEKGWFDPAAAAAGIVELLEPAAEEKGIAITAHLGSGIKMYGDERRIRQLLINLLGNALRHARSRIELNLSTGETKLSVTIKDDGWGIEAEEADQLFQRYYRKRTYADGSPAPRGIGLGLAVVKGIAEAHGGTASVSSTFGEGAAFTVQLPLFRE